MARKIRNRDLDDKLNTIINELGEVRNTLEELVDLLGYVEPDPPAPTQDDPSTEDQWYRVTSVDPVLASTVVLGGPPIQISSSFDFRVEDTANWDSNQANILAHIHYGTPRLTVAYIGYVHSRRRFFIRHGAFGTSFAYKPREIIDLDAPLKVGVEYHLAIDWSLQNQSLTVSLTSPETGLIFSRTYMTSSTSEQRNGNKLNLYISRDSEDEPVLTSYSFKNIFIGAV